MSNNRNDATASWDGFSYQGKITILLALKCINSGLMDIGKTSIEIEGLEDFSILETDAGVKKYISNHQVKHKTTSTTLNSHLSAIIGLLRVRRDNCESVLHVSEEITDWSYDKYLERIDSKIYSIYLETKKEEKQQQKLSSEIIDEKADVEKLKSKLAESQEKVSKKFIALEELIDIRGKACFDNISLYDYQVKSSSQKYCKGDEISNLLIEELQTFYQKNGLHRLTDANTLEIVKLNLIGIVDEHVGRRHITKSDVNTISLEEILDFLKNPTILNKGEKYYIYKLLDWYMYDELKVFCDNYCSQRDSCDENTDKAICELKGFLNKYTNCENGKFYDFIRTVNPHIINALSDKAEIEYYKTSPNFLYDILYNNFEKDFLKSDNKLVVKQENTYYVPTTIEVKEREIPFESVRIAKSILKNEGLLEDVYESNCFITSNIDVPDIFDKEYDEKDSERKELRRKLAKQNGYMSLSLSLMPLSKIGG